MPIPILLPKRLINTSSNLVRNIYDTTNHSFNYSELSVKIVPISTTNSRKSRRSRISQPSQSFMPLQEQYSELYHTKGSTYSIHNRQTHLKQAYKASAVPTRITKRLTTPPGTRGHHPFYLTHVICRIIGEMTSSHVSCRSDLVTLG